MSNYFNARWSRIFANAGLPVRANEDIYYPNTRVPSAGTTEATVGFKRNNPNFNGTRYFTMQSLVLSQLFKNVPDVHCFVYVPHSTREIAQALIDLYGAPLDATWFADDPIGPELYTNMPFDIDLRLISGPFRDASGNDKLRVRVYEPNSDIALTFTQTTLSKPSLPYTLQVGRTNVELLTAGVDFTALYPDDYVRIMEITSSNDLWNAGVPYVYRADVLVRLLGERLGLTVSRAALAGGDKTTLGLYGATFVYNGVTTGIAGADTAYDKVLVFDLNNTYQYGYTGRVFFHYTDLY